MTPAGFSDPLSYLSSTPQCGVTVVVRVPSSISDKDIKVTSELNQSDFSAYKLLGDGTFIQYLGSRYIRTAVRVAKTSKALLDIKQETVEHLSHIHSRFMMHRERI